MKRVIGLLVIGFAATLATANEPEKKPPMVELRTELAEAVLNYLAEQPAKETMQLILALQQDFGASVKKWQEQEKKKTEAEAKKNK